MDFIALWDQVVQNIAGRMTDDKEKNLIMIIGSQISIYIKDNVLTFQCKSPYVSTLLPEYISNFFKEVKTLTGIQNLGMNLQDASVPQPSFQQSAAQPQPTYNHQQPAAAYNTQDFNYQAAQASFNNNIPTAQPPKGANLLTPVLEPAHHQETLPEFLQKDRINQEKTFENYVTDPENQLIVAIAKKIAAEPGSSRTNPFYIYGGSGLGKTHLMFAIANEIRKSHPEKKLIYMRGEEFIKHFIETMSQTKKFDYQQINFRDFFTSQDIFIVDDIQNFVKSQGARATFFEIVADFIDIPNHQLILASDVPPGNLNGFNERLTSRFGSGVCREIYPPNSDTRAAITLNMCREYHLKLSDEIINYIATHIRSNVRDIEGAIKQLKSYVSLYHSLTLDEAIKELQNRVNNSNQSTSIESVKERVAKEFDVSVPEMESAERKRPITNARSMAMTIAQELIPTLSLNDIGRAFNKDHSSVHEAIKRTREKMEQEQEYNALYQKLILSLKKD